MKFSEKQLRQAAALAENYAMNHLPSERPHDFSEQFEHNMDVLRYRLANGTIKTDRIRMGWQYYTRRGVAAVLLGAILTCVAMPEAVIAGYQKFIEVVEQFVLDDARTVLRAQEEGFFPCVVGKEFPAFPSHLKRRRSPQERREEL